MHLKTFNCSLLYHFIPEMFSMQVSPNDTSNFDSNSVAPAKGDTSTLTEEEQAMFRDL